MDKQELGKQIEALPTSLALWGFGGKRNLKTKKCPQH